MAMKFVAKLFIVCLVIGSHSSKAKINSEIQLASLSFLKDFTIVRNLLLKNPNLDLLNLIANKEQMINQFIEITTKISALDQKLENLGTIVSTNYQAFWKILKLENQLQELSTIISQVNFAEDQLRAYLIQGYKNITVENQSHGNLSSESSLPKESFNINKNLEIPENRKRKKNDTKLTENFTLQDFATWAAGHGSSTPRALMSKLHNLVVPKANINMGLLELVQAASEETQSSVCNLSQSPHQIIYNLYNTIAITELKAFTILQFSFMLLKMYNKGNFTAEADIEQLKYEERAKKKLEVTQQIMSNADRSFYRCDPKQYIDGVTHTKLTKLLQGYIENEVNLNPYGTCRENCKYYTYTEYNGCFKNKFCAHQPQCRGKVVECRYVDSDMNICTSSNSDRRYDWIEYENGRILGNKGVCQSKHFFQVDSWWRYLFWHCSYCLCLCDENNHSSDRYFNLRDVTSDIKDNKVVTGVRIVKHNQIIHMQIQQSVLLPGGQVDKNSQSWKPVENYTIEDDNKYNNIDYHTMNWLERSIDIDEVIAPPEHVITGLRFRKIGTHLNLELRVTPINFTTGEVFQEGYSYWLGNDNTDGSLANPRTEILLSNPDIPIRNGPHFLNSKHDQFITFQPTSFDTDAGQTTVPFLDSQVLTSKGFLLSGIGLIHRGKVGSGGFIAPKLISYDYTPHLKTT